MCANLIKKKQHASASTFFFLLDRYLILILISITEDKYEPLIWILDTPYIYGNEFYGTNAGVALTPVTERCFLTMSQALNNYQGSCVSGPVGVGKTETVKGLATVLGHYIGTFQCSTESDTSAMGKIVQGTAMVCTVMFRKPLYSFWSLLRYTGTVFLGNNKGYMEAWYILCWLSCTVQKSRAYT